MQENIYQGFQFYFPWSHFKGNLHFNDTRGIHYFLYMSFEFGHCSHFHYSTNQLGAKNLKKMKLLWCTLAYDCCTSKAKLMFFETWQNLLPLRKANLCFLYRVKYRTLKIAGSYLAIDVDYTTHGFPRPAPPDTFQEDSFSIAFLQFLGLTTTQVILDPLYLFFRKIQLHILSVFLIPRVPLPGNSWCLRVLLL